MRTMADLFTRREYALLPEGFPAQLVEGCLVHEASPRYGHQHVSMGVVADLLPLVGRGRVMQGGADVPIDEHNVYVPDVAVFRERPPDDEGGVLVPQVVFEVLSPSTARYDRDVKCPRYLAAGVEEVWLLDRGTRTIEVFDRDGMRTAQGSEALASRSLAGFALVPDRAFSRPA